MTSPITRYHVIGGALTRYTRIPPAFPDPGDGSGGGGGHIELSGSATASGTVRTIYGYNWNDKDNVQQTVAGRKAKFNNRVPCVRVYGDTLTSTFSVSSTTAQEKRVCDSFKAGGSFTSTQLASSTAALDAMIANFESTPAGWERFFCYHHEPNSSGGLEVPLADYLGTYNQLMAAKAAATLNTGVKIHITSNFMAYQLRTSNWSDSWVPNCDILTWDIYGNPGNKTSATGTNKYGTANGSGYGTTYPLPLARTQEMWDITQATGFAASWGVLEVNAPLRDWDLNESGRVAWHQDMLDLFNAPPMTGNKPPKICLLWEAPSGANWVQTYGNNIQTDPTRTNGGTNTGSADLSPMWNVWKPYITGTPVGG